MKGSASQVVFPFFILLSIVALIFWIDTSVIVAVTSNVKFLITGRPKTSLDQPSQLNCSNTGLTTSPKTNTCPEHFRWIYEDLRPWKLTGISRDTLERAKHYAHFRLVIANGTAYVEKYSKPYQTRDVFTMWGILQLLRLYPGKVPDLELMFRCGDKTVIQKHDFQGTNAKLQPPVLFQYCGHEDTIDIVFPDWTFWGWAETNIKPWKRQLEGIIKGNKRIKWRDRKRYAYWRGNPYVSPNREDLLRCNVSDSYDWNARLYKQDWNNEKKQGYRHSKLEDQCTHRYKIYIEGNAWSVSEKYILACDSMTLLIKPEYYDFFTRSMVPLQHYWPITARNKCKGIKFSVEWGNNHSDKAQAIGKTGSKYIQESLKMEHVYDYMLHLLSEYAKLLTFKPKVPARAVKVSLASMLNSHDGVWKKLMVESMVKSPRTAFCPCTMPPPYDRRALQTFLEEKENITRQVEMWENNY